MLAAKAFTSLDFVDDHHLLFTFRQPRLLQREAKPGPLENDQVIRAEILGLPNGKIVASAEWRMHDKSRYLWPLGGGRFLVRQRNSYALTGVSLKLRPYIEVSTPVFETEVSPDGHLVVIEHEFEKHTPEQHNKLTAQAMQFGDPPPAEDTQITLLDADSREVLGALHTELPIQVPVTGNGYVGVTRDKSEDQFLVRFYPFAGQPVLVIESCGPKSEDVYLDAWTTEGKKLWSASRDGHLVWPTFAYSRSGGCFAVGLLRVAHPIDLADSLNDEDVREQVVQVFDTTTGALLMATNASPILTAGQNFALSDDGRRLAVLRGGAIEIYDVPSLPAPQKTDAPAAKKK
jgi:hypothetical protein